MANTINYTVPTIGATTDPQWESLLNSALTAIATHTHDGLNAGALLGPAAVSFAGGGFNFGNSGQLNAAYYDVAQQSSLPAQTAGHGRLACDTSGNLYYVSPTANVLLASSTAIAYSSAAKGFVGADYGVAGGAAYFNNSNSTWPYNAMFYLYASNATPTSDSGSRAGLGCGQISLKAAGYNCAVNFVDPTPGGSPEYSWLGILNQSLSSIEFRLDISRSSSNSNAVPALCVRETSTSAGTLSGTATIGARTYGLHLNGAPTNGTANAFYHYTVRANYPNTYNNTIQNVGYITRNHSDASGNIASVASGFGMRHCWNLQPPGAGSYGIGYSAAAEVISWDNAASYRSRYGLYVAASTIGLLATPGLEIVANSSNSNSVGIGMNADATTVSCGIGLNTSITGTLTVSGVLTTNSTSVLGGNVSVAGSVSATTNVGGASLSATSGGAAITGGLVVSSGGATITGNSTFNNQLTAGSLISPSLTASAALALFSLSGDITLGPQSNIVRSSQVNTALGTVAAPWGTVVANSILPQTNIDWGNGKQTKNSYIIFAAWINSAGAIVTQVNNLPNSNSIASISVSGGIFTINFSSSLPTNTIPMATCTDNGLGAGGIGIVSCYQVGTTQYIATTALSGNSATARSFAFMLLSANF